MCSVVSPSLIETFHRKTNIISVRVLKGDIFERKTAQDEDTANKDSHEGLLGVHPHFQLMPDE